MLSFWVLVSVGTDNNPWLTHTNNITGNQTANVSCAILERLFDDPNMKLWDYDPETLLPNLPTMVTFPHLENFYGDWAADLRSKGVDIRLNTDVTAILCRSNKGVILQTQLFDPDKNDHQGEHTGPLTKTDNFDEMVMAVLADDAKKLLGKTATWKEKFVLGGARFFDDITITHSDSKYFQQNYETRFDPELCAKPKSKQQEDQIKFAKNESTGLDGEPGGYRPMYYTHSYPEDPQKIEMSFDCTNYQHQFRMDHDADKAPIPYDQHVFQSIFLDKTNRHLWTIDRIDEDKVIEKKWWHQLGHRWQHYARVVPGMMFINGKNHTWFAGSWTLVVRGFNAPPSPPMRFFHKRELNLTCLCRTCMSLLVFQALPPPTAWVPSTRSLTTLPKISLKNIFLSRME